SYTMSYGYDRQGNATSLTYPDGRTVNYGYNGAGLVNGVNTKPQGGSTTAVTPSILYAINNKPSDIQFGNGVETTFTYDPLKLYRLTRIFTAANATTTTATSSALASGIVSYWKFDESSGVASDTAGSNSLTNNNTAPYSSAVINNGATLDATNNQYFSIPDAS